MEIKDLVEQARENRTTDQFEAYLKNYNVLIENMNTEEICIEVLLGDIYMESTGRKDKTMRYRNPPGHPLTILAEYTDLVFRTTDEEFDIDFPKWIEKTGKEAAMMACIKFLKSGKNDLSLQEFDLKTIRALTFFDAEPAFRAMDQMVRENDKKIPGLGARSLILVNATIKALVKMDTPRALQSLFRIQRNARYAKTEKSIRILLFDLKLSEAEIEDLKAPTYNFDEQLIRIETFGEFTVIVKILPGYRLEQKIHDSEGREYKDFPKSGLEEFRDVIKEHKGLEKLVVQDLRYYRDRIENTYRTGQNWKYTDWLRSYILHPLVGYSARRLIWVFTSDTGQRYTGMWFENYQNDAEPGGESLVRILDATGNPLPEMDEKWTVTLWHPVESVPDEQAAWKDRVMNLKVVQPFKQAFREVYTITPPELETATYTNRFAAHILFKQQFAQIATSRGWYVPNYFSHDIDDPSVEIRGHWVRFHMDASWGYETNASTDKVVFDRGVNLTSLPPIVFSEALRDVDMFVSVCSIGVDPTWMPDREGYAYWLKYTTRELGDSAVNRREVLQRILPGLIISDWCRIEDRWLFVEGKLHTYKIHIGSGSVIMEPSNQHLCIVPQPAKKSGADTVYLPFESDMMISLILSKAFLLANDTKITGQTILQQIKSRG